MQTQDLLYLLEKVFTNSQDVEVVWLYGSRAKGTEHKLSDVDLAIAFKNFSLSQQEKMARIHHIESLLVTEVISFKNPISCVDINTIPTYLAINVVNDGKVIYGKNSRRLLQEENRIYSKFEYENMDIKNG